MRIKTLAACVALAVVASSASGAGTFYFSEPTFVASINPTFYLEDFNSFTSGSPLSGSQTTTYVAPGANGYGWTASSPLGLYSNPGALSVNSANTPISISFTGSTVTALGGIFANTDISGNIIPGTVTVTTSDGGSQSISFNSATSGFLGYTSNIPIASVSMITTSGATNNWVQVDHFYTGAAAVPEPAAVSLLILGLGGLALARRHIVR